MDDITSPSREERDYEIILDKLSKLSLKEDLTTDHSIVAAQTTYYLIGNKIVTKTRSIILNWVLPVAH